MRMMIAHREVVKAPRPGPFSQRLKRGILNAVNIVQSSLRTLSITFDGAKEAVLAVAERVARRVQVTKLQLQATDAEERLRQAHESLGQHLYAARVAPSPDTASPTATVATVDGSLPLCEDIRSEQRALQEILDRLASRQDDTLIVPLLRLQEDLQAGGGAVERVTIAPNAHANGKPLSEVALPESVRIVLVRRNDGILFPSNQMVVRAGDQVTVIGNRSALPGAIQALLAYADPRER